MASSSSSSTSPPPPAGSTTNNTTTLDVKLPGHASNMLKIESLLNPDVSSHNTTQKNTGLLSSSISPVSSVTSSPIVSSDRSTPLSTSLTMARKAVNANHSPQVNRYQPFEIHDKSNGLTPPEQHQLSRQHAAFKVLPPSGQSRDSIAKSTRHIPYSSDKKTFGGKTGKGGFDVFEYSFQVPGHGTKYDVMWDYNNGLVRITPFFKACNYTKTVPAKAINTNPGLKDLSFSITGGSLAAQGYWMPFNCARELCATFCYDIRWALTPIFGPTFMRDCLRKDEPGFGKFKIDVATVHNAQMEARRWAKKGSGGRKIIPKSVPPQAADGGGKELPPRAARPSFKAGSVFGSASNASSKVNSANQSPDVSPKTAYSSPGWNSINKAAKTPLNMPFGSLSSSLLNQSVFPNWRPAGPADLTDASESNSSRKSNKRRRSSVKQPKLVTTSDYDAEASESEWDDEDLVVSDSNRVKRPKKKAARVTKRGDFTEDEQEAAKALLGLMMEDSKLSSMPASWKH